jgi:hypothetical protein
VSYLEIKAIAERAANDAVAIGVPSSEATEAAMAFSAKLINAYAEAEKRRRFLQRYKEAGSRALAEELNVTPRAIRKRRHVYLKNGTNP